MNTTHRTIVEWVLVALIVVASFLGLVYLRKHGITH